MTWTLSTGLSPFLYQQIFRLHPPPPAPRFPANANHNPFLTKIVDELDNILNPPPPPEEPKVPEFPIRGNTAKIILTSN
jgi:hypothetical protein